MREDGDRFRSILENRSDVLRALADAPATKPELAATLDTSRSTIDRAIRDLQTVECITSTEGGYTATTTGRVALAEFDRYAQATDAIFETQVFINSLPRDAPLDPAILTGASVTLSEQHAPDQALKPSLEVFERATSLHGLAPAVLSFYPDIIIEQIQAEDLTVEIVAEEDVLAVLPNLSSSKVEPLVTHENVTLYRSVGELPYALWLMGTPDGDVAGITAYESGGVAGVLINETDTAVDWAWNEFEASRDAAGEISPSRI